MVESQFHTKVKIIRSDNAFELESGTTQSEYFLSQGIQHQLLVYLLHNRMALLKKKYKHLLQTSRALLYQSNLPI